MSPLWSDMALARAAWAKAEEFESVGEGAGARPKANASRPPRRAVRRVLRPRLNSFAL
jgi:hypothetical protein